MAAALAAAGARVAICGRNAERGFECARRTDGTFFPADATSPESLAATHADIEAKLGAPTILVNAAGGNDVRVTVTETHPFEAIAPDDWRANFDLNVAGGAVLPCQEFGAAMVRRGAGTIINIASVSAHVPLSRVVAYSAAKAAVLSLTQFLAREWAPHGVRVNSITPGFFPAEQNRRLLFNEDGTPTARTNAIWNHTPMRRFGSPNELAGALLFLASSKASSFVTGADIRVDGGFLAQTI